MFLKGELVYIGQTVNLRSRMFKHPLEFEHDCIRYIKCPKEKLKEYEKRLIKILGPKKNSHHQTPENKLKHMFHRYYSYKTPYWMYFYESCTLIKAALKHRDFKYQSKEDLEHDLEVKTLQFEHFYKKLGYKGTYLE